MPKMLHTNRRPRCGFNAPDLSLDWLPAPASSGGR